MGTKFIKTDIDGVLIIEPEVFGDKRGFFLETWHKERYRRGGVGADFVQDNHSRSEKGVIRGLHYQLKRAQDKLVYAVRGTIFDVAVDIRRDSPTFGKWTGCILSEENRRQFFIPRGFAHGFSVLSDFADITYKCSDFYAPGDEYGILYRDTDLAIDWKVAPPLVSEKDAANPSLAQIPKEHLF
ncbi:MAG: dTDP-4-dehydrorhamnose 3,5-epimerase [Desulfamplus sp.]|nr:dTDP-4-dehydrorhamnose 3,5-epimerase [Desulfamplus sp.]